MIGFKDNRLTTDYIIVIGYGAQTMKYITMTKKNHQTGVLLSE